MNKNSFHRTTFTVVFLFLGLLVAAQVTTVVKATADKTSILIGEPIVITLEADIPEQDLIRFFILDSIPHFEFLAKEKIDTTNTGSGTRLRQVIRITSFDSGHWVIPPFVVGGALVTDSIPVDVGFTPFNAEQPYNDIKDIIAVDEQTEQKKEHWWWYAAGGGLLLILLLYALFRKKKTTAVAVEAPPVDPYKQAMEALAQLQKQQPEARLYYSALTTIFRVYVAAAKNISSMQKTTDDLVVQLRSLPIPKDKLDALAKSLRLSDFVKFAKYIPSATDDAMVFENIKEMIQLLETEK